MTAANPQTESDIITKLRADGISSSDLTDAKLLTIIDSALDEYLFIKPKISLTTSATCIETAADQPSYSLPTGALWVREVAWYPGYTNTDYEIIWQELMLRNLRDTDTSVLTFDYREMANLTKFFRGSWEILDDKIFLKPCPDAVYHVPVIYATSRTLDELDQIADRRFYHLCKYMALEAVGIAKTTSGGWSAGQYRQNDSVGKETLKVAREGLAMVRAQIGNAYTAGRS